MNWRALAIFSWLLATGLAFWIVRDALAGRNLARVGVAEVVPQLQLVEPVTTGVAATAPPALPVTSPVPDVAMPVAAPGPVCVRLGKFPTRAWAQRVADVLTLPAPGAPEQAVAYRLRGGDERGYFIVFPDWALTQLSVRLAEKTTPLRRWVSASARPEICQPAER